MIRRMRRLAANKAKRTADRLANISMTGAQFLALRESLGLSQDWCAKQIGASRRSLCYWESGDILLPDKARDFILKACADAVAFDFEGYPASFQRTLAGLELRGWGPQILKGGGR
jgi:DNA-binding transcriptional regulator YiaG